MKTEWISVKDKLPPQNRNHNWNWVYMPLTSFPRQQAAVFNMFNQWKINGEDLTSEVTHWMPLPEPPKQ